LRDWTFLWRRSKLFDSMSWNYSQLNCQRALEWYLSLQHSDCYCSLKTVEGCPRRLKNCLGYYWGHHEVLDHDESYYCYYCALLARLRVLLCLLCHHDLHGACRHGLTVRHRVLCEACWSWHYYFVNYCCPDLRTQICRGVGREDDGLPSGVRTETVAGAGKTGVTVTVGWPRTRWYHSLLGRILRAKLQEEASSRHLAFPASPQWAVPWEMEARAGSGRLAWRRPSFIQAMKGAGRNQGKKEERKRPL
jgi:hypothetical protein